MQTDLEIIERIIADEGGDRLVDNPADPGGITKFGITLPALKDFCRAERLPEARPDDIRNMRHDLAVGFYTWLLESSKIGQLYDPLLRWFVFDAAVHMGNVQAIKLLQRAVGVEDDGILGPQTLARSAARDARAACVLVGVEQALFYGRLAAKNLTDADKDGVPDQLEFLPGYLNRWARKMQEVTR